MTFPSLAEVVPARSCHGLGTIRSHMTRTSFSRSSMDSWRDDAQLGLPNQGSEKLGAEATEPGSLRFGLAFRKEPSLIRLTYRSPSLGTMKSQRLWSGTVANGLKRFPNVTSILTACSELQSTVPPTTDHRYARAGIPDAMCL